MYVQEKLQEYYRQDARKLKNIVNKIIASFGGISQKDYDDFYSVANETIANAIQGFDNTRNFDTYIYACLTNKIKTEITRRNRLKRMADKNCISIDAPCSEDGEISNSELLVSSIDIENDYLFRNSFENVSAEVEIYLSNLSEKQRQIAEMIMNGYETEEIKEKLKLTDCKLTEYLKDMKSFEKASVLKRSLKNKEEKRMETAQTQTMEKSKMEKYSIDSIVKKMDRHTIRFDHPAQRGSEQWAAKMKGNLISDILQGNPVPPLIFAEQIIQGMSVIWDLDGKQRCTNAYSFKNDGFKINKNIRRPIIKYQAIAKNDNGELLLDETGLPIMEWKECDIRNKKYSQLPEELQEKFDDYTFDATLYLNCTDEDIVYHIERYNDGRPMNHSQKGVVRLGVDYATVTKGIANMSFFKDNGNYKTSEFRNGTIERVVVESVMASFYLNEWRKGQEDICEFLRDNATIDDFDTLEENIDRIDKVVADETAVLFTSKDSFIWFALFEKFKDFNLPDERFDDFLRKFNSALRLVNINGETFETLNENRATKDKAIVIRKFKYLELLMEKYLMGDTQVA